VLCAALAVPLITKNSPLLLGSASPRRRDLLEGLRLPLRVLPAGAEEDKLPEEAALVYLERVVEDKLAAVRARLVAEPGPFAALLVADTIVVLDDDVLGKPSDVREAETLLGRLCGRTHSVFTRYALADGSDPSRSISSRSVESRVTLRRAEPDEIARYAATGEGLDKAGAYAAQGIGAFLVERIEGSYSNVVGLPVCELVVDLQRAGLLVGFP
jgi:septum formation protein